MLGTELPLLSPEALRRELPLGREEEAFIQRSQETIQAILSGRDTRLLVVVGPCSIHNLDETIMYAKRLKALADSIQDRAFIVLRAYFQKSRTAGGWQGFLLDPHLDGSKDLLFGLKQARRLAVDLARLRMPIGMELVDTIAPHYLEDCLSWGAIGARTVESSLHRHMASGAPFPIGFKNNTEGNLATAIQALRVASKAQTFADINLQGGLCIKKTLGNPWGHVILRGGRQGMNYGEIAIQETLASLKQEGLALRLMIDCAHGNSTKHGTCQTAVFKAALQLRKNYPEIIGIMLESYLKSGKQPFPTDIKDLQAGLSLTDACLGWKETERLLETV